MKDLALLFETIEKLGFDISGITFEQAISLKIEIEEILKRDLGSKKQINS